MRGWLVVLALICACRCKKDIGEECESILDCNCVHGRCQSGLAGSPCEKGYQCDFRNHIDCVDGVCRGPGKAGEPCGRCETGLTCHHSKCLTEPQIATAKAAAAEAARKRAAEKEAHMLEQSGVASTPAAEVTTPPPGPGTRIRTVKVTAKDSAFAACKLDERLVGGGCDAPHPAAGSFPSGTGADDTVGARWNCRVGPGHEVTAYALCARLP